jgi:hypothetical protein
MFALIHYYANCLTLWHPIIPARRASPSGATASHRLFQHGYVETRHTVSAYYHCSEGSMYASLAE